MIYKAKNRWGKRATEMKTNQENTTQSYAFQIIWYRGPICTIHKTYLELLIQEISLTQDHLFLLDTEG